MTDSEVWALNLLPVVKKQPEGMPGAPDTFSDEQLNYLVYLREVKGKNWGRIAEIMNRPLTSCHRRYAAIKAARAPKPEPQPKALSAAPSRKTPRLHEELGIRTYTIYRNSLISIRRERERGFHQVERIIPITLSAGIVTR